MNNMFKELSDSKYFLGVIMVLFNIGAKYIIEELTPKQKELLNTKIVRRIIIFCSFFIATKDILASITLTLIFVLFISNMFDDIIKDKENTKN